MVIYRIYNEWKSCSLLPLLSTKDLHVIESYVHFQFPESTRIVRAYWEGRESIWHYLSFEFDKNNIKQFMESLHWDKEIVGEFSGNLSWHEEQDPQKLDDFTGAIIKDFYGPGSHPPPERLEWWNPDREKIGLVFCIEEAELKDIPAYVYTFILLEELETTCRAYVYIRWDGFEGSWGYLQRFRKLFPWHPDWKHRERKSKPYPLRNEENDVLAQ